MKVETSGIIEAIGSNASIYFSASTAPAAGTYTVDNFGTILANQSATVWFQQGAVINEATGHIEAENGSLMVFETGNAIINLGLLEAVTGSELDVKDSEINWAGATPIAGTNGILIGGSSSELLVDVTNLQLTGGGAVLLLSGSLIYGNGSSGSPDTLENVDNTISGAGTIGHNGDGDLALTNDSHGIIDATGTVVLFTGNAVGNAGLLEATAGGELDVKDSKIENSGNSATGTGIVIDASSTLLVDVATLTLDGGGTLVLQGTITGANAGNDLVNVSNTINQTGTISNLMLTNDAAIDVTGNGTFNNVALTNAGSGNVNVSGTLNLTGADTINNGQLNNAGTMNVGLGGGTNGNVLIENETGAAVVGSGTNSFTNVGTLTVASGSTLTLTADLVNNTGGAITATARLC